MGLRWRSYGIWRDQPSVARRDRQIAKATAAPPIIVTGIKSYDYWMSIISPDPAARPINEIGPLKRL